MSEKNKILFVITKGNFGGAQRYVYDLATSLPKEEFEVVVVCGEGETLKNKLREKNIKVIDMIFSQRDLSFKKDLRLFFELRKIVLDEKPDILHLNSSKIGGIGALVGRLCNTKKIIFTAHGWTFNENRGGLSKLIILFFHWLTIILSHKTIAVSEKAKRDVSKLPFISQKIEVIYNGLSDFGKLERSEARKLLGVNDNQKVIFSLAELHNNKGIDIALKAISILPEKIKSDLIYIIAGDGEEKENLISLSNGLKIEKNIKFLGFIDNGRNLLCGVDIFLLPSRTEAFPYVILEAGITGLPIIATNVGGIPEVIHNMENGILVHPKNPKEIAEAISYLLEHEKLSYDFGTKIKEKVSNFFSLDKMIEETKKIYKP